MRKAFLLVALLVAAACGGDSPSGPGSNIAGNWSGSISSNLVGNGTLTVTFLQSGNTLSGTWATTFTDPSYNDSGSLSGAVDGAQVAATLTPSDPTSCPYNVAGTLSGQAINGTYAAFDCTVSASGSFAVDKQ